MKRIIFLSTILISFSFCKAQRLNKLYYGVSSDSLHRGHQVEFKTGNTLELSTFPRHMSQQFKMTMSYQRMGKTIKVIKGNISSSDSTALSNYGLMQFLNEVTFSIEDKAIIDTSSKIVYVLYKDFNKGYYLTYIIDGRTYKQEAGLPDGYGIIKNSPKENKVLKGKLDSIRDDLPNYIVIVYKGLDAYKKYGYDSVFGVIELRQRN